MKAIVVSLALVLIAGCRTLTGSDYPYEGPLLDSAGNIVPPPTYVAPDTAQ